jgi:ABC-type polysaccharide/polyol phosphate export permease
MLWTVLIPAGSAAVYYLVFSFVLKVNVEHHLLFIICNLIPWTFFSATLISGLESIFYNAALLNKIPLPIQSLALAEAMTHFLNLLLSLPVIAGVMIISGVWPSWPMIQYIPLLAVLFLLSYSMSLILGLGFVYFRDLKFIVTLVLQFWFYLTPIMYTSSMIPERVRFALDLNPVGLLFMGLGSSMTEGHWLTGREWLIIVAWTTAITLIARLMLLRLRENIVEIL